MKIQTSEKIGDASSGSNAKNKVVKKASKISAKREMDRYAAALNILTAIEQKEIEGMQATTKRFLETRH